jgi:hypothetical protein
LKIFITKYRAYPKLLKMIGEQMFISFAMIWKLESLKTR